MTSNHSLVARGATTLLLPVPNLPRALCSLRNQWDPTARQKLPPHVTASYPYLHESRVNAEVIAELRDCCLEHDAIDVSFARTARFPGVLYLAPDPAEPFLALTEEFTRRWPECPPYGGAYSSVVP